jgi:hypothetical protein
VISYLTDIHKNRIDEFTKDKKELFTILSLTAVA